MGTVGMMETCDRCERTIFLKYIGRVETDGGYTSWDKFENLPIDWLKQNGVGILCPDCTKEFKRVMTEFYGRDKVPKAWEAPYNF